MSIIRSNPFRELEAIQARLNRMFNAAPLRAEDEPSFGDWNPPLDIEETDKEYGVTVDLPDVKKEDIKIELHDGVLTIEGERKLEKEEKGTTYHRIERQYGQFVRRFTVPGVVDPAAIQAEFKNGVLKVRLPKTATTKPKAIDIKVV